MGASFVDAVNYVVKTQLPSVALADDPVRLPPGGAAPRNRVFDASRATPAAGVDATPKQSGHGGVVLHLSYLRAQTRASEGDMAIARWSEPTSLQAARALALQRGALGAA